MKRSNFSASAVLKMTMVFGVLAVSGCSTTPPPDCDQALHDGAEGNAGCLIVQGDALVMVQQSLTGHWSIPGGTAEEGERSVCAAARETYEETGLKVRVVEKLSVLNEDFHLYHCVDDDLELNQTPYKNDLVPVDAIEVRSAKWQSPQQREKLEWRFPDQKKLINQIIDQLSETP